jgi:hypothetical protein
MWNRDSPVSVVSLQGTYFLYQFTKDYTQKEYSFTLNATQRNTFNMVDKKNPEK